MEFVLPRPAGVLLRLGAVSRDALRSLTASADPIVATGSREALLLLLDEAAIVADDLARQVAASDESQPLANAASICRWELGRLRARGEAIKLVAEGRAERASILRHLDEAMKAAQILSTGYRFHSLDRICHGGQSLDDHFDALARLRIKLAAQQK